MMDTTFLAVEQQVSSGTRNQKRLVAVFAILILGLTLVEFAQDLPTLAFHLDALLIWLSCWLLFVLADLLAGPIEIGFWAGYLYISGTILLFLQGLNPALLLIISGSLVAAHLRTLPINIKLAPFVRSSFCFYQLLARIALTGTALVVTHLVFSALGGTTPLTLDDLPVVELLTAFFAGIVAAYVLGYGFVGTVQPPILLWAVSWRERITGDFLLAFLIVPMVLVYDAIGLGAFIILLGSIGVQAIRLHQYGQATHRLEQHIHDLSLLNNVGQNIAANLQLEDVAGAIYDWVSQFTQPALFYIGLLDEPQKTMDFPLVIQNQQHVQWKSRPVDSDPVIKTVVETHTLVKLDSGTQQQGEGSGTEKVYLGFPLMVGSKFIGVMTLADYAENRLLEKVDIQTFETVANQAALAIRNAMLYRRSVRLAENLKCINQSVQDVMFNLDGENAMQVACETAMQIVGSRGAAIFLPDEDRNESKLMLSVGLNAEHREIYNSVVYRPNIHIEQPYVVGDVDELDERDVLAEVSRVGAFRAFAEIPLKSGNTLVGLLIVYHDLPHYYHETELELLETLAHEAAAALENAALLNALEQYASEQAQLVQLSRISTASLEIETIVQGVDEMLQQMFNVDQIRIGVVWGEEVRVHHNDGHLQEILAISDVTEFAQTFRQKVLAPRIFYISQEPISAPIVQIMGQPVAVLVAVPLVANNIPIGLLMIANGKARDFSDGEWRLIELAGNQIAAQLHNAQRYQDTQAALNQRLQQLSFIENIAQQITSALEPEQLIRNVLQAATGATQADIGAVALRVDDTAVRIIIMEQLNGQWVDYQTVRDQQVGLIGRVMRTGEIMLVPDNTMYSEYAGSLAGKPYQSSLLIPLRRDNEIVGVLDLESVQPGFFKEEQVEFVRSLAGHAVISLQNAHLLEERQAQIDTLTQLRELALEVSSETDRRSVAKAVLQTALDVSNGGGAALYYYEAPQDDLALLASVRKDGDGRVQDAPVWVPQSVIVESVHHGDIQVIDNVQQHPAFVVEEGHDALDYTSALIIPLRRGNRIQEVLCVVFATSRSLDSSLNALTLLTIQAAGHLENALLHEQILTNSNRMRAILDSTRDGIILLDRAGDLIQANISAESLLGISLEDYIGENFVELLMSQTRSGGNQDEVMRESLTDMWRILRSEPQRIISRSFEIIKNGKPIYIEEVGSPVMGNHGEIVGRLLTLRDVTEERLLAAYRDEISSMVVHDLRGPLGSIISSLTLTQEIAQEIGDDTIPTLIEVSRNSADQLLTLVDSLLDIARLETRRMPLKQTPTTINELVANAHVTLMSAINEAEITVDVAVPEDLPLVNVDSDKVRRVLINILDNAIRHTPSGKKILINAETYDERRVLVRIADSGVGIPPEEAERVFEKFRQVPNVNPSRGRKGTGLGLTFCKLTVEAHGGQIWVERNGPLSGASFVFTLPIAAAD